jgi:hypothetical protein
MISWRSASVLVFLISIGEFRKPIEYTVASLYPGVCQGIVTYFIPRETGNDNK